MRPDNDLLGPDAIAFGLMRVICLAMAKSLGRQNGSDAVALLVALEAGLKNGVVGLSPELRAKLRPGDLDSAAGRVAAVLREAVRDAERAAAGRSG